MSGILAALAGIKTAIATAVDEYFNRVTLLLNTSSTNGAQNNTFLDSSTNNFTITRNGNTTQGTFTPFSQTGWSNYFNGSSDYLTTNSSTALNLSTNDFTVECFVNVTTASNQIVIAGVNAAAGTGSWQLQLNYSSAQVRFFCKYGGGNALDATFGTGNIPANAWNHIAVTRSGANLRVFLNGTQIGTTNTTLGTSSIDAAGANYKIGQTVDAYPGWYLSGYLSNIRVVIGTALYTSNFTPNTTPLTAVTNTALLTCQSNRFIDNSTNALTLTPTGTPSVQAFSPFLPTAAYDTAVVGGSGYFDGTGDYLTAPNNAAFDFNSGNFTIEFWVYSNGDNEYMPVEKTINGAYGSWYIQVTSGSLKWNCSSTGSSNDMFNSVNVGTVPTYAWTHIAIVRNGTTFTGYINGVGTALGTSSSAIYNSSYGITVGAHNGTSSYDLNGHIAGLRLIKGTAAYTSNFTPPTAPPTAITNTSLLLNFTNAGIYDSAAKNDLETVGNAQVSTTQAKWGTTSMYFDGTGDTLNSSPSQVLSLGSGNWTIECWVRLNATGTETNIGQSKNYYTAGFNGNFVFRVGTSNLWRSFDGQSNQATIDGSFSWSTGVWYHVAWVRNSGTVTVYRDGTSLGSVADSKTLSDSANGIIIGSSLNAYIDDLRITVGLARYTANFTAPTAAFPLQ